MKNSPFLPVILNSNFLKLWISQILSQLTINIVNFVLVTHIFETTGSSIAVSFLWISYALPSILLLPISGPFVDTVNRRPILFFTNLFQAATVLFFLPFTSGSIYQIFPIVFIYSALNQFYLPAESASIADLVPAKHLPAANSLFLLTSQAMFILGFGVGGLILSILGPQLPFVISFLMLTIAAIAISFLPGNKSKKLEILPGLANFVKEFAVGYNYIKNQPGIFFPLGLLAGGNLLFSVIAAIFPQIGKDILGSSVRHTGPTLIVPVGVGALLGGVIVPRLLHRFRIRRIVEMGMLILIIAIISFAVITPLVAELLSAPTRARLAIGIPSISLIGFASVMVLIPCQTILQQRTPEILRGRILSAASFLMTLASIVPLIFGAAVSEFLGIKTTFILIALSIAIALYISRKSADRYILVNQKSK